MDARLDGPFGQLALSAPALTIGRAPANQLVLKDGKASGYHAEIRSLGQEGYSITDLGSTNGTFVNEHRLKQGVPRPLANGDIIRVGDTSFMYVVPEVQAVTPTFYSPRNGQGVAPTVYSQPKGVPPTVYAQPPGGQGIPPTAYAQSNPAQYNNALQSTVAASSPQSTAAAPPPSTSYTPQSSVPTPPVPLACVPPVPSLPVSAPAQPRKRNLLWLWITLGGVGLLLAIIFIVMAASAAASTPSKTLEAFCTDLKNRDYHAAHTAFSPRFRQKNPERYFVGLLTLSNVNFVSCTYSSVQEDGDTATATVSYQFSNGKSETDQAALMKDSDGDWKIDRLQTLTQS